jgi:hypothetical protein
MYKSNSDSITGATLASCCDKKCSGFICPRDYHDKPNLASIAGQTVSACCDHDLCSGNADQSDDFFCGTDKVLKPNSNLIAGASDHECCDLLCTGFACPAGTQPKTSTSAIKGFTSALCCDVDVTNLCVGNTNPIDDVVCSVECTGDVCLSTPNTGTTKTQFGNVCSSCCSPPWRYDEDTAMSRKTSTLSSIAVAVVLLCFAA